MTVVSPVKVLAPASASTPLPIFVRPPERPSRVPPVAARLPIEPASSTLLPLVSTRTVPKREMPPGIAPGPEVMSVVEPAAQRSVPPSAMSPPAPVP